MHVIYLNPLTPGTVAINVFLILVVFAGCCLVGMLISYISQLHATLDFTNIEHTKLLHGMHEGVLILGSSQDQVMFSNRPAKRVLNHFCIEDEDGDKDRTLNLKKILTSPAFVQLKIMQTNDE